ncbi:hypothetical protein Hokovirus_3_187 [Hokovirus HKV1]|uniref:Uncharacterized protein n=1 Tax=Hokovirus HKV1 TaxID=1977638 RepID=A0A1V0SH01_9VIRU|nr:hypothetical protein Hokovirus_3_187 [Hokovirus HKV1]
MSDLEDSIEHINTNEIEINMNNIIKNVNTKNEPLEEEIHTETIKTLDINDNDKWNWKIVTLFRNVGEKSLGYRWMHEQEAVYNDNVHYAFLIVEVILGAILGSLTSATLLIIIIKSNSTNSIIVSIVLNAFILVITFIFAIVYGIHQLNDYPETRRRHKYYASKYNTISTKIKRQLALPINKRKNDKDYAIKIEAMYNTCQFEEPQIRPKTAKRYLKIVNEGRITKPMNLTDFDSIEVVMTAECPKCSKLQKNRGLNQKILINDDTQFNHEVARFLRAF